MAYSLPKYQSPEWYRLFAPVYTSEMLGFTEDEAMNTAEPKTPANAKKFCQTGRERQAR